MSCMKQYLMGIDNGSTMTKAGIYDLEGNEIAVFGSKCDVMMLHAGYYERDMAEIWNANVEAISQTIRMSGIDPKDIAAVAITGHGNGMHLVDENGQPVGNAIEGADARAASYVEKWNGDGTFEKVHPKSMQILWPALSACIMAWVTDNQSEMLEKAKWFLSVTDYVRFMLTGEAYAEITSLSGTGLLNCKDGKYDREMLENMDIGEIMDILPPIASSIDVCGAVTKQAAKLTRLCEGTPVIGGLYDIDAAGIATGMTDESNINVIVGTWCNNQYVSKTPVVNKAFFSTTVYAVPGYSLMLEGSPTSASNLEWFVSEFLSEEAKIAKQSGSSVYEVCNEAVRNTNPEDTNIVFVPFLYGSNAGPNAKSVLVGLEGWHKRAHVIRAIYEGICFSHKWHIGKLMEYREKPDAARMAGGAVRSDVWVQMFADVLQMPMEITGASELGTLGAAICAGVGARLFADFDEATDTMVKVVGRVEPDLAKKEIYERKYYRYKKAIACLDDYWK